MFVAPSAAQVAGGPVVAIDAPVEAQGREPTLPLAPADQRTAAPLIGVVAGLAVLGATLARISIRRRTALAGAIPDVVVVRTGHAHISAGPAPPPTLGPAMPSAASSR
ncbi:MAG: hypothetical protein ACRD12_11470 [Acidimicrobiales bacterium]